MKHDEGQRLRVAAVQMVSGDNVARNLATAGRLIEAAARQGARLVVLPEYFALLSPDGQAKVACAEVPGSGPMQDFLASTAAACGVWLLGGTVPLKADDAGKVRNALLVHAPDGERRARYDKIHLFGFRREAEAFDEAATIEPGSAPVRVDTCAGPTALSVCYDLRFPELFRALLPVNLIALPAAFTCTTGRAHWSLLLRARAVENQCFVVASAQGGEHPGGRQTWGHSMIIDPWGEVLACQEHPGEGVVCADLDFERLAEVRRMLPVLTHRRL